MRRDPQGVGGAGDDWERPTLLNPPSRREGYQWIDLNEYSLEPQKVAKDSQTTNFGDGVKTYFLSNSQVLKQYY